MKISKFFALLVACGAVGGAHASFEMLLVLDAGTKSIHRFDPQSGAYLGQFGAGWLNNPQSIVIDQSTGTAYVRDTLAGAGIGAIVAFDYNTGERKAGFIGGLPFQSSAVQMARNPNTGEFLCIGGTGANGLLRISSTGVVTPIQVNTDPSGVAFNPANNEIYFAFAGFNTVERYTNGLGLVGSKVVGVAFGDGQLTLGGTTKKGYFATGFGRVMGFDLGLTTITQINMTDFSATKGVAFGHGDVLFTCGLNAAGTDGLVGRFDVGLGVAGGTFGSGQLSNPVSLACVVAPEPATWLALAGGLALVVRSRRRQ